ncbi:RagB/SusD family nutrient uptake outer membrane protein [Maribellus comscasis]|uniref:RagB/SusD family nutrient uptake outer membrane protein n=1 Tax=Maribellus comscasis TaxID=2681766 RepID=A0A6I6JIV5_9BACT|nr:RagB/SusD family nutrient uptake outer membrane protein [Maribellus comscasis]QGY42795.1 RagB/SusD family nutrient uptake outer membrane protein [Maribellus comscasis]
MQRIITMNNIKKYLILVFITLAGISCDQDSFFELERPNQFPWTNVSELELGVREPYYLLNKGPWDNPFGTIALKNFTESDLALYIPQFVGASNSAAYYNRDFSEAACINEMEGAFLKCYEIITACNGPLQMLSDAEENGEEPFPGMTQTDKNKVNQLKGELLFMRGLAYWYLARMYAPPYDPNGSNDGRFFTLRLEFSNSSEELKNPTLGTVAEVYEAIENDWTNAKELLYEDNTSVINESNARARANKFAASAMLMRLYFIKGEHAKAEAECNYIISNGSSIYDLTEDPIEAFNKNGADGWGKEVIWQTACEETSGAYGRIESIFSRNHYARDAQSSWSSQAMSYSAMMQVGWMDENHAETEEAQNDKRYTQLYYRYDVDPRSDLVPPLVWSYKYFRASDARRSNRPLIRLAEIYLTRALIRLNNNDSQGAAADLNMVRNRAGLDNIAAADITKAAIDNERIKELATENGDRTYYLIGQQLPLYIGDRDASNFSSIQPPYSACYWQVPQSEQDQNQAYN